MRKRRDLYLCGLLRTGIAVVGLLVMIAIIATAQSTAREQCRCLYPALTKLLDEDKCTPLVCTDRDIAVTCEAAQHTQTKTFNIIYLAQGASEFAICRTLTESGHASPKSVIIEDFVSTAAEVDDCKSILYQACPQAQAVANHGD